MAARIVPFPAPKDRPSREELVKRVKEMAGDSENIHFDHPHIKLRLDKRNRTMRQVLEVLKHGEAIDGPKLDKYGDWRIKLKKRVAGVRVQVVVAVKESHFVVVTVI